jgi:DNA-binding beta-propeller fold protein YncE
MALAGCGSRVAPLPKAAGGRPSAPRTSLLYVLDTPPALIPVDLAHHRTGTPITLPGDTIGPVRVTADGRTAYVMVGATLVTVDLATGVRRRPIPVPEGSSAYAISPDMRTAYVLAGGALVPIDLRSGKAGRDIVVPDLFDGNIVITAGGRTAYLTGMTISSTTGLPDHPVIQPVDLSTGKTGALMIVPGALVGAMQGAAVIAPDGRTAYAASGNVLQAIDLSTGRVGRPLVLPSMLGIGAIAISADGRTAYVGNVKPEKPLSGVVVAVDLNTFKAEPPILVPSYPYSITDIVIAPDGRTAYLAAYAAVIPIDLVTKKPGTPIRMPAGTQAVVLAPGG